MRTTFLVIALFLVAFIPAFGQEEQTLAIPVPAGAEIVTEMNLSHDQIVGQLNLWMGMLPCGQLASKIDTKKLKESLDSLKYVQYVEMNVTGGFSDENALAFFESEVPGRRVLYNIDDSLGNGVILISTADGGYFAATTKCSDKAGTGQIRAARLFGFPDVAKAVEAVVPVMDTTPAKSVPHSKPAKKSAPRRSK